MAGQMLTNMYGAGYNQSTLDAGMQLGDTFYIYDFANYGWKEIMLVQAGETLSANAALKWSALGEVEMVDTAGDICVGVNDCSGITPPPTSNGPGTGASVTDTYYFYMTIRGIANVLEDASVADKAALATGSATPGQLVAWTDGTTTFRQTNLQNQEASGAGGATLAWIM